MIKSKQLLSLLEGQDYVTLISVGKDHDAAMKDAEAAFKEMLHDDVPFEAESMVVDDNPDGIYFKYPAKFLDKHVFDGEKFKNVRMG